MMDLSPFFAFLPAAALLTVTPGLDTAMVLRAATVDGRRCAAMAALGIALGCLVWGATVALGLGVVLRASEVAYTVVKFMGAGYLVWLGGQMLLQPRQSLATAAEQTRTPSGGLSLRRGFLTNILNPKVGVFYVTFLPQFIPTGAGVAGYSFFLACLHITLTLLWFAILIAATLPISRWLRQPGAVRCLDRLTGGVFIAFGLKLATSSAAK